MSAEVLESLRSANRSILALLAGLEPPAGSPAALQPHELSRLLETMAQAGSRLRTLQAGIYDSEVEEEAAEYRANVEHLGRILPHLHGWLLAEKARLEKAHGHLAAAAAWAEASRKTL